MKKKLFFSLLFSLFVIVAFTSCEQEEIIAPTTYTVEADLDFIRELAEEYNASYSIELRFYEYNDNNEMVEYKIWNNPVGQKQFTATELSTKVVVFLDTEISLGGKTLDYSAYDAKIHYLKKEGNITIVNNGETLGQKYNPID